MCVAAAMSMLYEHCCCSLVSHASLKSETDLCAAGQLDYDKKRRSALQSLQQPSLEGCRAEELQVITVWSALSSESLHTVWRVRITSFGWMKRHCNRLWFQTGKAAA